MKIKNLFAVIVYTLIGLQALTFIFTPLFTKMNDIKAYTTFLKDYKYMFIMMWCVGLLVAVSYIFEGSIKHYLDHKYANKKRKR